ncbi:MAG: NAD(P)-binding protein [Deltaproteobacteria bacterium]|nr:NAD(P)-binding protein [Deltaproteobacteria bacterium]
MRVAVVGSGIAGLTATWKLGLEHEVELFEAQPTLGMDAASVSVDLGRAHARVDVPLRVFGSGYYPRLTELYAEAGIPRGGADYSASYSRLGGPSYFAYKTVELGGDRAVSLPDPRVGRPSENLTRLAQGARFYLSEPLRLKAGAIGDVALEAYLCRRGYAAAFTEDVLYPTLAAILTCSQDDVRAAPAAAVIDFFGRSAGTSFGRVATGTRTVVERLSARAARIHVGTPVRRVRRASDGVLVEAGEAEQRFDHVVMATQAHLARRLVADLDDEERALFDAVGVTSFECVVHSDPALMPEDRRGWRPINALIGDPRGMPMYTMWMNAIIDDLGGRPDLFQTINPLRAPDPALEHHRIRLDRPLLDLEGQAAVRRLAELQRAPGRRLWFCGSYLTDGFPLLEAGVVSASAVAEGILGSGAAAPPARRSGPRRP